MWWNRGKSFERFCGTQENDQIEAVNKKYGKQLFAYGLLREVFLSRIVREGAVWTLLLYQMLALRVLSGAQLVTSRSCIWGTSSNMEVIIDSLRTIAENAAYIYRIREFLQMESTIVSDKNEMVPCGAGSLSVEHVDFGYMAGKPVFISHRLSTVWDADCIYMMEDGKIVESVTHEELLAENGKYAAMWNIQAGLYAQS